MYMYIVHTGRGSLCQNSNFAAHNGWSISWQKPSQSGDGQGLPCGIIRFERVQHFQVVM